MEVEGLAGVTHGVWDRSSGASAAAVRRRRAGGARRRRSGTVRRDEARTAAPTAVARSRRRRRPVPGDATDGAGRPRPVRCRRGRCPRGRVWLVAGPRRTAAYVSRTTLGCVFPERLRPLVDATADLSDRFRGGRPHPLPGGGLGARRHRGRADGGAGRRRRRPTSTSPPTPGPTTSRRSCAGWADAVWTQGKRFGTIGCLRGDQKYEITTHRAEAYRPDSRKPDVAFGDRIEDDLARRDFTVNAMALRLPDLELIDPFGGLVDLAERRLRTPLDPEVSFADDPLRMLRAARFIAQLDLEPDRRAGGRRARRPRPARRSCRPSGSATSWTRSWWCPSRRRPCGSSCAPAWPSEFLPELPGLALEQDPIHRHKDVLGPHPGRGGQDVARTGCSGWPPSSTTWASPGPGPSSTAGSPSTTTRWWGPA